MSTFVGKRVLAVVYFGEPRKEIILGHQNPPNICVGVCGALSKLNPYPYLRPKRDFPLPTYFRSDCTQELLQLVFRLHSYRFIPKIVPNCRPDWINCSLFQLKFLPYSRPKCLLNHTVWYSAHKPVPGGEGRHSQKWISKSHNHNAGHRKFNIATNPPICVHP